ncbi:putative vacuolar membrane protein [Cyphellophora attinorum]|uniref:Putative vacuolar membrane protein n=1 Tax=Cyphellophora attinorum TaxID=1664694 RepID=A0A0N1HRT7_9EURO|nr:putative vacuolar membrane protein [Phialophora attinorum]KPI38632.1 putative vacuolar membrane protein [Phialophora attinorum]
MSQWLSSTSSNFFGRPKADALPGNENFEMDNSHPTTSGAGVDTPQDHKAERIPGAMRGLGVARHTLGLLLLLLVVCLWTTCNFLASSIFADDTYAQPFFLTYLNTSMFILAMVPSMVRMFWDLRRRGLWQERVEEIKHNYRSGGWRAVTKDPAAVGENDDSADLIKDLVEDEEADGEGEGLISHNISRSNEPRRTHLALLPTAKLALGFCFLWFGANYFALACLEFTTVASTTILTSTSSIWTLIIGAVTRTERFTWRKLLGVLASLFGIVLISTIDSGTPTATPGDDGNSTTNSALLVLRAVKEFPQKSSSELLLGDALALLSALIYGFYTVLLARTTKSAAPLELNMPLFFGLVGTWNFVLLLPLFPILHWTGIEPFEMPPTGRVWLIMLTNSVAALASDICWAYAMVLTSPLVVTVGLSLTIPLSLIGEMLIQGRYEGVWYWVGAAVVVGSFVFVDGEERRDVGAAAVTGGEPRALDTSAAVRRDDDSDDDGLEIPR